MKQTIKRALGIYLAFVLTLHLIGYTFLAMTLELAYQRDRHEKIFPGIDLKEFK
ncbi:MAG: hypothetical protein ABFQ89_02340 [Chloroflexota bacterium]